MRHGFLFYALVSTLLLGGLISCEPEGPSHEWEWPEKPQEPEKPEEPEKPQEPEKPDEPEVNDGKGVVLVVGGGASGCCAGIQSARMGMETIIVEESPWLGGMLTAAGVTATDGCYYLRGGLFGEFTDKLAGKYGAMARSRPAG